MLYNSNQWKIIEKELSKAGHNLIAVDENLIDQVWGEDRPARPSNPVTILEERWTGRSLKDKLVDLRESIKEKNCIAIVLTALDDVACKYFSLVQTPMVKLCRSFLLSY